MYTTTVQRDFIAQHWLTGGDWGPENQKHSHHYRVVVECMGESLDAHGYLVDIVEITQALDEAASGLRDRSLNDLPEFAGLNPSLEHLCRILHTALVGRIHAANLSRLRVQVWENEMAWSAYEQALSRA